MVAEKIKTGKLFEKGKFGKTAVYKHVQLFDEIKAKVTKTSNPPYLAHFSNTEDAKKKFSFIGLLDKTKLERSGFGIEKNTNKEIYAGHHNNDLREGRGVYRYKDTDDGKYTTSSIYMGYWQKNMKHGEGTFIWRTEQNKKVKTYESCLLTAFVGFFYEDKYDVGLFCEDGDDQTLSIYFGRFNENKKNDDEGIFYYHSPAEFYVVVANVEKDLVKEGYRFDFDINDKKFKHFNHFKAIMDNVQIVSEEEMDEEEDLYETIMQSDNQDDLTNELKNKFEIAKKMFMLVQKEKGDFKKIYEAFNDGEKAYKDINTIEDFYLKYAGSLKSLQGESAIQIDDKLAKAFPKQSQKSKRSSN